MTSTGIGTEELSRRVVGRVRNLRSSRRNRQDVPEVELLLSKRAKRYLRKADVACSGLEVRGPSPMIVFVIYPPGIGPVISGAVVVIDNGGCFGA